MQYELNCEHDLSQALVVTDIRLARQYSFHAVFIPGNEEPRWCKTFEQVAFELLQAEILTAVLCSASQHYRLTLPPEGK